MVKEILNDSQCTVLIHLWKPSAKARSLSAARYKPAYRDEAEELVQVDPAHIVQLGLAFDDEGYPNQAGRLAMKRATRRKTGKPLGSSKNGSSSSAARVKPQRRATKRSTAKPKASSKSGNNSPVTRVKPTQPKARPKPARHRYPTRSRTKRP